MVRFKLDRFPRDGSAAPRNPGRLSFPPPSTLPDTDALTSAFRHLGIESATASTPHPTITRLLGMAVPGLRNRITRGQETYSTRSFADAATVQPLVDEIVSDYRCDVSDFSARSAATLARAKELETAYFAMEANLVSIGRLTQQQVAWTRQKSSTDLIAQYPDGVPTIAKLILVGHYPTGHASLMGLTGEDFSTSLLKTAGLCSALETGDYRTCLINSVPFHHWPAPNKTGGPHYVTNAAGTNFTVVPKPMLDLCYNHFRDTLAQVWDTPGKRIVVAFGQENQKLVNTLALNSQHQVWQWDHVSTGLDAWSESGHDTVVNICLASLLRGTGPDGHVSRGNVPKTIWDAFGFKLARVYELLGKGMFQRKTRATISMVLVHSAVSSTLHLLVPHPQCADVAEGNHDRVVALDLATLYASDYVSGRLASGTLLPPKWSAME